MSAYHSHQAFQLSQSWNIWKPKNSHNNTGTMSMMFTVHVYVYVCLLWNGTIGRSINVLSQAQSLSPEMNEYFVAIAYSNNVYFFAISGDPLGGATPPPQKKKNSGSPYFQAPITLLVIQALVMYTVFQNNSNLLKLLVSRANTHFPLWCFGTVGWASEKASSLWSPAPKLYQQFLSGWQTSSVLTYENWPLKQKLK